jgi:hypothetical protein
VRLAMAWQSRRAAILVIIYSLTLVFLHTKHKVSQTSILTERMSATFVFLVFSSIVSRIFKFLIHQHCIDRLDFLDAWILLCIRLHRISLLVLLFHTPYHRNSTLSHDTNDPETVRLRLHRTNRIHDFKQTSQLEIEVRTRGLRSYQNELVTSTLHSSVEHHTTTSRYTHSPNTPTHQLHYSRKFTFVFFTFPNLIHRDRLHQIQIPRLNDKEAQD